MKTQNLYLAVAIVAALVTGYWLAYARFVPAAQGFETLRQLLGL